MSGEQSPLSPESEGGPFPDAGRGVAMTSWKSALEPGVSEVAAFCAGTFEISPL